MINIHYIKENEPNVICLSMNCPNYKKCKISSCNNKDKKGESYKSFDFRNCELNKEE